MHLINTNDVNEHQISRISQVGFVKTVLQNSAKILVNGSEYFPKWIGFKWIF